MNMPQKPMVMVKKELQDKLIAEINTVIQQYQPPFFILEGILKDLYTEVVEKSKQELQQAQGQYRQAMAEYEMAMSANEPSVAEVTEKSED